MQQQRRKAGEPLKRKKPGIMESSSGQLNGMTIMLSYSTFASANPMVSVHRWDKKRKEAVEVTCQSIVQTYNKSMGGVALLGLLIA